MSVDVVHTAQPPSTDNRVDLKTPTQHGSVCVYENAMWAWEVESRVCVRVWVQRAVVHPWLSKRGESGEAWVLFSMSLILFLKWDLRLG